MRLSGVGDKGSSQLFRGMCKSHLPVPPLMEGAVERSAVENCRHFRGRNLPNEQRNSRCWPDEWLAQVPSQPYRHRASNDLIADTEKNALGIPLAQGVER